MCSLYGHIVVTAAAAAANKHIISRVCIIDRELAANNASEKERKMLSVIST